MTDAETLIRETTVPAAGPQMTGAATPRRLPIGAEPLPEGGTHFRVWAPRCRELAVEIGGLPAVPLSSEPGGYFSGLVCDARPGMRYRLRPDRGAEAYEEGQWTAARHREGPREEEEQGQGRAPPS